MNVVEGALLGGRYRLDRELGRGGMGEVWAAVDEQGGRRVAVKLLLEASGVFDVDGYRRFEREAQTVRALSHPNIVTCWAFEAPANEPAFMVMELLEGESLRDRISRERLDVPAAVAVMLQVTSALEAVHAVGIVHRDVKPANVFCCANGVVKVLDFGVLKLVDESGSSFSRSGLLVGTPGYMAPEQIRGELVTPRTDVYACGVCLFEMLTGVLPFDGRGASLLARVRDGTPRRADALARHVPRSLADVVDRALAPDPRDRHGSMAELTAALAGAEVAPRTMRLPGAPPLPLSASPTEPAPTVLAANGGGHGDATVLQSSPPDAPLEPTLRSPRGRSGEG